MGPNRISTWCREWRECNDIFTLDRIPPIISITTPPDNFETYETSLVLGGTCTDQYGIEKLVIESEEETYIINNFPDDHFEQSLDLTLGDNIIKVTCYDSHWNKTEVTKTVTRLEDISGPVISESNISPSEGEITTQFLFTATIVDGISTIRPGTVSMTIHNGDSSLVWTLDLNDDGNGGDVQAGDNIFSIAFIPSNLPMTARDELFQVDIRATDNSSKRNMTFRNNVDNFFVFDRPIISKISLTPATIFGDDIINCVVSVNDYSSVPSTTISYYPDGSGDIITKTLTYNVMEDKFSTQFGPLGHGMYHYFVTATDPYGKSSQSTTSELRVLDRAPYTLNPISDIIADEDADPVYINLQNVFTDPDDNDLFITTIVSYNSNLSLINAFIYGRTLRIDFNENAYGNAIVTVESVDDSPRILNPIGNKDYPEDSEGIILDIASVFTDIDNDDNSISIIIDNNTNPGLVTPVLDGFKLTLSMQENQFGSSKIALKAISNGLSATDTLYLTVYSVDDPPVVKNVIENISVDKNASPQHVDLSSTFTDVDNDDELITIAVINNTNPDLISTNIDNHQLTITIIPNMTGSAELTLQAMSNGQTVNLTFTVTVDFSDYIRYENEFIEKIYPNPSNSILYIELKEHFDEKILIEIIDISGNKLYVYESVFNKQLLIIDISQLIPSVYFLKIINKESAKVFKFIKSK